MTIEETKANYDRIFSKHTLEMVLNNDPFRAYMLRPPEGGRLNGVMIMFTPEGIVIAGDHAPGRYGMVSQIGYGLDWFSTRKGAEYLAQKFGVERIWVLEYAADFLRGTIKDLRALGDDQDEAFEEYTELLEHVESGDSGEHDFYSTLTELNVDCAYEIAQGYNPDIICKLAAIQHRFADLMGDMEKDVSQLQDTQTTPQP